MKKNKFALFATIIALVAAPQAKADITVYRNTTKTTTVKTTKTYQPAPSPTPAPAPNSDLPLTALSEPAQQVVYASQPVHQVVYASQPAPQVVYVQQPAPQVVYVREEPNYTRFLTPRISVGCGYYGRPYRHCGWGPRPMHLRCGGRYRGW